MNKYPNGMTIADLKELLKDLPDTNPNTGEPFEVWITTETGLSSICVEYNKLNAGDILLTPSGYVVLSELVGYWKELARREEAAARDALALICETYTDIVDQFNPNAVEDFVAKWKQRRFNK